MKSFIKAAIIVLLVASVNPSFANGGNNAGPLQSYTFSASVKQYHSLFVNEKAAAKVCVCQILNVNSANEKDKYIAVFAQRTNNGDLSSDFNVAQSIIDKEKKHLKSFFYTKIKVMESRAEATSCDILFRNFKVKYADLHMYDILDADILNNIYLANK